MSRRTVPNDRQGVTNIQLFGFTLITQPNDCIVRGSKMEFNAKIIGPQLGISLKVFK